MGIEVKNPGALAGAAGVEKTDQQAKDYLSRSETARRHLKAARILRSALCLWTHRLSEEGRMAIWLDFARLAIAHLTEEERALIVYWLGRTLSPDVRATVFEGAHWRLWDGD